MGYLLAIIFMLILFGMMEEWLEHIRYMSDRNIRLDKEQKNEFDEHVNEYFVKEKDET